MPSFGQKSFEIYPSLHRPYYIVTPDYVRQSAGIRALHLLCHALNLLQHPAYLVRLRKNKPQLFEEVRTDPRLITPTLTLGRHQEHLNRNLNPIVIYPETVAGNPLEASCVVRYVLNFPGLLGGDAHFDKREIIFGYSEELARAGGGNPENVIFIPASDTSIFYPKPNIVREGTCFYAGKHRDLGGELQETTANSIEILRGKNGQPTEEVADIFRRSKIFYTYENTALAIEAVLCGCPAVLLPNEYLTQRIGAKELGDEGYAWGASLKAIEWAQKTVTQGRSNYLRLLEDFWAQLEKFIDKTQPAPSQSDKIRIRIPLVNSWMAKISFSRRFKRLLVANAILCTILIWIIIKLIFLG